MRKQKILLLLIIVLLSLNNSHAQGTNTDTLLTLQKCVDIAIKNNLQVKQSELTSQSSKVSYRQAIENMLPSFSASANQGLSYGRTISSVNNGYIDQQTDNGSYSLNGSIILFSGLQLQNAIRQNSYAYDASKMDWQQQKDNITLQVILDYLQVLSNEDLLAITREQASTDSQSVARAEIQNKEGAIAPSTLTDLQGQYAGDLVNIATAINALETSKINLYNLLNIPYDRTVRYERIAMDVQLPVYPANSDSIFRTALQIIPAIKSADLRVKQYEKALKVARGAYWPTLYFNGSVGTTYSSLATNTFEGLPYINDTTINYVSTNTGDYSVIEKNPTVTSSNISWGDQFKNNRGTSLGLSLQIPILNSFRARNNVKLAKINLENYKYTASATKLQLQQMVEQAYQNMISAYGQYKSYEDQVAAYTQSFRSADIRFQAGVITSVDYLVVKNSYDRANTSLIAARYNYIFRMKILDYYQGRLTW